MASPQPSILIVDGNALNRRLAEQFLLQLGCRCGLVPSAAEALNAVVRETWDAVLIELNLPDQSGMEMARRLRQRVEEAGYPMPRLVAIADSGSARTRVLCRLAGIRQFLVRPLTIPALEVALVLKPGLAPERDGDRVLVETLEGLRDMAGRKFVFDLIDILAREGPQRLHAIGEVLATGNLPVACRLFHKMKGSASSFGAVELNRICEVGDDACAEGNADLARDCYRLAGEELVELAVFLHKWKEGETE